MACRLNQIRCCRKVERRPRDPNAFTQVSGLDMDSVESNRCNISADGAEIIGDCGGQHFLGRERGGYDGGVIEFRRPAIGCPIDHGAVAEAVGSDHDRAIDLELLLSGCRHDTVSMICSFCRSIFWDRSIVSDWAAFHGCERATTSPMTSKAGPSPTDEARFVSSDRRPTTALEPGSVPRARTATGVVGARPAPISPSRTNAAEVSPM